MRLRSVAGAVGAIATGVAALAVAGPDLPGVGDALGSLSAALAGPGSRGLLLVSVGVAALSLLAAVLVPTGERVVTDDGAAKRFERVLDRPPEGVTDAAPRTGGEVDDAIERFVAGDDAAVGTVRNRLRDLATATLARREESDAGPSASERVATGAWTDDRTAAAFLADDPAPSLRSRVRLWLDPEYECERRVRRTVRAVERLGADVPLTGMTDANPAVNDGASDRGEERDDEDGAADGQTGRERA